MATLKKTIGPVPGARFMEFIHELYPVCRSITGNGLRETLKKIQTIIPLEIVEVPTGTKVLDWEIPKEWNIREAWIKNAAGERLVDFGKLNLHVLNYSTPVHGKMKAGELAPHVFTIPEKPSLVPYRTSYYNENWGFCMSHHLWTRMLQSEEEYEVMIDSDLSPGSLSYGEYFIEGEITDEVLISTHVCHPSLANDNLSGMAVCAFLAGAVAGNKPYYSYRFLFVPGTIGAIAWLAQNEKNLKKIKYGLVTSLLGIDSKFTYKRARNTDARINRILEYILGKYPDSEIQNFIPYGYDERQYCSPGFNLPVGNICRIPFGQYPEYHTSADNPDFISPKALEDSFSLFAEVFQFIEAERKFLNLFPKGEPQLGRRGIYDAIGGRNDSKALQMAFLWILNYSDRDHTLSDIAMLSGIAPELLCTAAEILLSKELITEWNTL